MVPTRQCSPLTHQWVGVTLWGHTTAQWRMTEESLQRQWLYQVRLEPSHADIHTFPLFSVHITVVDAHTPPCHEIRTFNNNYTKSPTISWKYPTVWKQKQTRTIKEFFLSSTIWYSSPGQLSVHSENIFASAMILLLHIASRAVTRCSQNLTAVLVFLLQVTWLH